MSEPDAERPFDRWIRPYFSDPSLWPVMLVLAAVLTTFGGVLLLLAFAERNLFAQAALALLALMSADGLRPSLRQRRLGLGAGLILGSWATSGLAAWGALRLGLF